MARTTRNWHRKFGEYMQLIVSHPNYNDMPQPYKDDGTIRWVVTGNSAVGRLREAWWNDKRQLLGVEKKPGWKAKVARQIHPFGEKPCQICGKSMSLDYVYPNRTCPYEKNILEECDRYSCDRFIGKGECPHLGPGAMSDAPDRFDGYHTYNRCCRSTEDTGRHSDNLGRYGEDRRAYEFWVEGDWKAASWLMRVFGRHGVSADHIGPLSLGFCHRPKFRPMTRGDNTAKGNRMTMQDVRDLLQEESNGIPIVSWHSHFVWDRIKNLVRNDEEAIKLSALMRENLHNVLLLFAFISSKGFDECLIEEFLHPEYALYQHKFINFDPTSGEYEEIVTTPANRTQHKRNAQRYIRKSLEALERYKQKLNRKTKSILTSDTVIQSKMDNIVAALSQGDRKSAMSHVQHILEILADRALVKFKSNRAISNTVT